MKDTSGRELMNRAIVVVHTEYHGLQFGVVEDTFHLAKIRIVYKDLTEEVVYDYDGLNVLTVRHSQLPDSIKDRLIELSKIRIQGPGELQ